MGKVNISDYKKIYLTTAKEYIDSLTKSCIELSNNPSNIDAQNQLHISSHSLRSQSQVMGYNNIVNVTGAIEKIASEILEGKHSINERIISLLREAIMEINLLLADIENEKKEKNLDYLIKKLDDASSI